MRSFNIGFGMLKQAVGPGICTQLSAGFVTAFTLRSLAPYAAKKDKDGPKTKAVGPPVPL